MKIAFLNQKGGVGKTTVAHNTAYFLANSLNKKVLLVDLDPQGNASSIYVENRDLEPSVASIFKEKAFNANEAISSAIVKGNKVDNLDIIHSNKSISQALKEIPVRTHREKILDKSIDKLVVKYDYIIYDCPASIEDSVINAIYSADKFLVPIEMGGFVSSAIQDMLEIIAEVKEFDSLVELLHSKSVFFLKNKIDKRGKKLNNSIATELQAIKDFILDNGIHHSLFVSRATNDKLPIFEYKEMKSSVKEDYKNYIEELIRKCSQI